MMDFIRDIYASFRQASLERIKSPILGTFVFSWLAFNWKLLAVLALSKKDIELRLVYIQVHLNAFDAFIWPTVTTALICFYLPRLNKYVTKIQDAPTVETTKMKLFAQIKIAELQQEIAEIEARKKLADMKEEKYIEKNIRDIEERIKLVEHENTKHEIYIQKIEQQLQDEKLASGDLSTRLSIEHEAKEKLINELSKERKSAEDFKNEIKKDIEKTMSLQMENKSLINRIAEQEAFEKQAQIQIEQLKDDYPYLFRSYRNKQNKNIRMTPSVQEKLKKLNHEIELGIASRIYRSSEEINQQLDL